QLLKTNRPRSSEPDEVLAQTGELKLRAGEPIPPVYYRVPYASPPSLKFTGENAERLRLQEQTSRGFKVSSADDAVQGSPTVTWRAEGLRGSLQTLEAEPFLQEGTVLVQPRGTAEVFYKVPYQTPPHLTLEGSFFIDCTITDQKPTGFKVRYHPQPGVSEA